MIVYTYKFKAIRIHKIYTHIAISYSSPSIEVKA